MRLACCFGIFALILVGTVLPVWSLDDAVAQDEFRGVWITRFEWPNRNAETCRNNITTLFDSASSNGFNAVIFQVRGQADVLYSSALEPWSAIFGETYPGFDPMQFAIEEAHKRGLEFHAYINAFPVWSGSRKPTRKEHLYWTHCQPDSPENWLCCGQDGQPMAINEYYYLSPGIPAVQDYIRKVVMDVVQRYDVDGIHLDRIRYPGPQVSHDPVSKTRFQGDGNPDGLNWEDWQRDQVTRMLNNLYAEIQAVKPKVLLSCSVWGIYDRTRIPGYGKFSSGYHDYYQDSQRWAQLGVVDALVPMIYWDIPDPAPNYDTLLTDFVKHSGGRFVFGGYHGKFDFDEIDAEIQFTRQAGGQGAVAFASGYLTRNGHWKEYGKRTYSKPASPPVPAWKSKPTTGIITGRVLDPDGVPIVDTWVQVEGQNGTELSSGDGFFAILNLKPGMYNLQFKKGGFAVQSKRSVYVPAGTVTNIEVRMEPEY